jgi:hypothetical protein
MTKVRTIELQLRTRVFARVLTQFFVVIAATTVVHASDVRTLLSDVDANGAWQWVLGAFLLLGASWGTAQAGAIHGQFVDASTVIPVSCRTNVVAAG